MDTYFGFGPDEKSVKREKQKARELRQSQWWKRKTAKGVCHWCENRFAPSALTMDHIVPLARGGRSVKGNVVPCCKACNTNKRQMLPMEWEGYLAKARKNIDGS